MIYETISEISKRATISANFKKAVDFVLNTDISSLPDGKGEIDGKNVFYNKQSYLTKDKANAKMETHHKYIDIQYILEGEETMEYAPLSTLTTLEEYNVDKDIMYHNAEQAYEFVVKAGEYAIFFPTDGHRPSYSTPSGKAVKKLLIKIAID